MKPWLRITLILLGILLTLACILPLLIPIPPVGDTRPPQELADADSLFLEVDDLELHYKRAGAGGTPLVLLHGFGASVFTWREVLEPLGEDQLVVAFDRPAFGLTERPLPPYLNDTNPYTPFAQADLTTGLMEALEIEQAVLVGNSAGGTIALLTALEYPDRVAALILVDPAVYAGGGAPAWIRPLLNLPQIDRLGPLVARTIRDQGPATIGASWHDPSKITPDIIQGFTRPLQADNWDRALWEFTQASRELKLETRLDELEMPVLVITGDDDRVVPTEDSIRLAQAIPGAELAVLPACGHLPQEECPAAFLQAVQAFLAGLPERN